MASHFAQAARGFQLLEPSHGSDRRAFAQGMEELRAVLCEFVFGQDWPQELPPVDGPVYRQTEKAGGLSKAEQEVGHHLVRIWADTHQQIPRASLSRLATAIHHGQDVLQVRALRRIHPDYWNRMASVVDQVSPAQDRSLAARKAVSHYARAYQEFGQLVRTHPSEGVEFQAGFNALGEVLRKELFAGKWPDSNPLRVEEPTTSADLSSRGGLTRSEQMVMHHLNQAALHTLSGVDQERFGQEVGDALRQCQNILGSRVLRRRHPDYWMASPGSLEAESAQEQARWG